MNRKDIRRIVETVEKMLNTEIPGTPKIGGRVAYVALPGRGKNREALSRRASQVYAYLTEHKAATSKALQRGLRVNRNVIAGAMHELRQAKLVRATPLDAMQTAGERRR